MDVPSNAYARQIYIFAFVLFISSSCMLTVVSFIFSLFSAVFLHGKLYKISFHIIN